MRDLFETPELLPVEVQELFNAYEALETKDFADTEKLFKDVFAHGYVFEYDFSGMFELQKIKGKVFLVEGQILTRKQLNGRGISRFQMQAISALEIGEEEHFPMDGDTSGERGYWDIKRLS